MTSTAQMMLVLLFLLPVKKHSPRFARICFARQFIMTMASMFSFGVPMQLWAPRIEYCYGQYPAECRDFVAEFVRNPVITLSAEDRVGLIFCRTSTSVPYDFSIRGYSLIEISDVTYTSFFVAPIIIATTTISSLASTSSSRFCL